MIAAPLSAQSETLDCSADCQLKDNRSSLLASAKSAGDGKLAAGTDSPEPPKENDKKLSPKELDIADKLKKALANGNYDDLSDLTKAIPKNSGPEFAKHLEKLLPGHKVELNDKELKIVVPGVFTAGGGTHTILR